MNRLALSLVPFAPLLGQPAPTGAREIMEEVQRRQKAASLHYEGTLEVSGGGGRVATKSWIFDRIGSFGESRSVLRFTVPAEVKGVALLIVNHPDRASDQWIWRPAIGREQRVAIQDRSTRFFGTDFSFEDLEERDLNQYEFRIASSEGANWVLDAKPKKASQYETTKVTVSKDRYTVTQVECFGKKGLVRTIQYRDFERIKNIWTARTVAVADAQRNSRTTLRYDRVDYNAAMRESDFTVDALRRR
jgi:hypothetical protein